MGEDFYSDVEDLDMEDFKSNYGLSDNDVKMIIKRLMKKSEDNIKLRGEDRCDYCEFFDEENKWLCDICMGIE